MCSRSFVYSFANEISISRSMLSGWLEGGGVSKMIHVTIYIRELQAYSGKYDGLEIYFFLWSGFPSSPLSDLSSLI